MRDTSPDAAKAQADAYRKMSGAQRVMVACEMSEAVRAMARSRIRALHPEYDDTAVRDELTWELYGVRRSR